MSEPTPDRTVTGLAARRRAEPDVSRMRRTDRSAEPSQPAPAPTTSLASSSPRPAPVGGGAKTKTTVYVDAELNARAKAAFKATAHLENDRTWSEFVEKALTAEIARRQERHNDGTPYLPDNTRLSPGRPLA